MGYKLGMNGKLYYLAMGTRAAWPATGAPSNLTEIDIVGDVTLNLSAGEANINFRGNAGYRATVATLKEASVEFTMVYDTSKATFTALRDAFLNGTTIALAVLDGDKDTDGTQGFWADFTVLNFPRGEAMEEAMAINVTVKPTYSDVDPEWVTVSSS